MWLHLITLSCWLRCQIPGCFVRCVTGLRGSCQSCWASGPKTKSETGMTLQLLRPLRTLRLKGIGLPSDVLQSNLLISLCGINLFCEALSWSGACGWKFCSSNKILALPWGLTEQKISTLPANHVGTVCNHLLSTLHAQKCFDYTSCVKFYWAKNSVLDLWLPYLQFVYGLCQRCDF